MRAIWICLAEESLFELICTARTRSGEETLAAWLLTAAPLEKIVPTGCPVSELKGRVGFRERLFLLGETVRVGVHPEALSALGRAKSNSGIRSSADCDRSTALVFRLDRGNGEPGAYGGLAQSRWRFR